MSGGRKLSDAQLQKLEQSIGNEYTSLQGQLKALQGTIDDLEAHWVGLGANAFGAKQDELNQHIRDMGRQLEKFLGALKQTRTGKDETEDQIQAEIKKIHAAETSSALNSY
jgi:WXG100 family type VII secretion target